MYYFLGNCQADFVCEVMKRRQHPCSHRVLASTLTYPSHPGAVPKSLAALQTQFDLDKYFIGRLPENQFTPVSGREETPELIVLSLFHETGPLFVHNDEEYIFYLDATALNDKPEVLRWAQDNCRMFKPNPATYLDRFRTMVEQLRRDIPGVPIIILNRLSHFPAFGPDPYSYLEGWETLWPKAEGMLADLASGLQDIHILDMNRVFGGIWNDSDNTIETYCPFLKIELEEMDGQVTGLHARRDIEHIGPLPERLADKIEQFLETGTINHGENETIPMAWRRQWRINKLDETTMLAKLRSGANYQAAEAVASFYLDLGKDHTDLLVQAREQMPICHNTLHMIKQYGRIFKNPTLSLWCDTQLEKAEQFINNGPLYQADYIKRLQEMKSMLSGK